MEEFNCRTIPGAEPDLPALPHSDEAEQQIIGRLVLDNEAWIEVSDIISVEDFFQGIHRLIFRHIINLLDKGMVADVVTIFDSMQRSHGIDPTEENEYLKRIVDNTPCTSRIRHYVDIVRDNSIRRSLIDACDVTKRNALQPLGRDAKQILDEAQARIFCLGEETVRSRVPVTSLSGALGQISERVREQSDCNSIATGFIDLDNMISGLQRGDLIAIAGPPGVGKTALSLNITEHVSLDLGLPVLIFSLKFSVHQLALRFLASKARVDLAKLKSAALNDEDWSELSPALDQLRSAKVFINQDGMIDPVALRACARRVHRHCNGLGLIVIDSLQRIGGHQVAVNRQDELRSISQMLKALAKELNVPVIVLSQLPRKFDKGSEQPLANLDLRDLGAIDQIADLVMLLYRDEYDLAKASMDEAVTQVRICKNRNGPTCDLGLVFAKKYCRFENMDRADTSD